MYVDARLQFFKTVGITSAIAISIILLGGSLLYRLGLGGYDNYSILTWYVLVSSANIIWLRALEMNRRFGAVSAFFWVHFIFIQIGFLIIYFAAQRQEILDHLLLGFETVSNEMALLFSQSIMSCYLLGVTISKFTNKQKWEIANYISRNKEKVAGVIIVFILCFVYFSVAMQFSGGFLTLQAKSSGVDIQNLRLNYHYGNPKHFLLNPSIVSQVYLAAFPLIIFYVAQLTSQNGYSTRYRLLLFAMIVIYLFVLLNALERTPIMQAFMWGILVYYYIRGTINKTAVLITAIIFISLSLLIHSTPDNTIGDILLYNVLRRLFIVQSMVNYFDFNYVHNVSLIKFGGTYLAYFKAIVGAGQSYAKQHYALMFPSHKVVGTAPVGVVTEFWINFGWFSLPLMAFYGFLLAKIDCLLRSRPNTALEISFAAGIVILVGQSAFAGLLPTMFSGGMLFLIVFYILIRRINSVLARYPR